MRAMQKGFTLIELMIIIAVIGILAAIILPMYDNYIAHAQATEGYELLGGLKTPLVEVITASSNAVACKGTTGTSDNQPWFQSAVTTGKYVDNVVTAVDSPNRGLMATFKTASAGISDKVAGHKIVMTLNPSDGRWTCKSDLSKNVSPAACHDAIQFIA